MALGARHWKANHKDAVRRKRVKDKIIRDLRTNLKELLQRFKIVCPDMDGQIDDRDVELIKKTEGIISEHTQES